MTKEVGRAYETNDFGMFEMMPGNREDAAVRMKRIEESVEKVGYIPAPIIVTDRNPKTGRYRIVEGQARYTYCKSTGTPFTYFFIPGLTVEDCIAMNASSTNWSLIDYIRSFARMGNESYILMLQCLEKSPYPINISTWALLHTDLGNVNKTVKSGSLTVTQKMVNDAEILIAYWKRFDDIRTNRRTQFYTAIGYCFLLHCVDNETLDKKIHQQSKAFLTIATVLDAIRIIEEVYNSRRHGHVYIETEFLKYLDERKSGLGKIVKAKQESVQERIRW